ncbi:helix-turn-helix domain-containing protein [Maritalea porphyrae]|uniref:helix-turn-helix domain-containing protein n=1 Tax=Maritalea porphyrae TaxID=880732 RepID=UPI0022B012DC|nr:helix-turn-helix transcriptional regulator [Maritalea porphyrae]MCZ4273372.1 helix-turn-helix transcriptional regulator [Maritalea porphyrae]
MPRSIHSDQYKRLTTMLLATRKSAGMTQQDVADRLGKPQSYVAKIEGNERRIDLVEFVALAEALGIEPSTMFANALSVISISK